MLKLTLVSIMIISAFGQNVFSNTRKSLIIRFGPNETKVLNAILLKNELEGQLSQSFCSS